MANDRALPYALKKFRNFNEVASPFYTNKVDLIKKHNKLLAVFLSYNNYLFNSLSSLK